MENSKTILIVEDSPSDYEAIVRAFKKMKVDNPLFHCETGEEAMDYLQKEKKYSDQNEAPRPSIILLDLNLPGLDGRSVLRKVKNNPALKTIPVIVLTTSNSEQDIDECYKSGANSYITKPLDWGQFMDSINNFRAFWLNTAMLPVNA